MSNEGRFPILISAFVLGFSSAPLRPMFLVSASINAFYRPLPKFYGVMDNGGNRYVNTAQNRNRLGGGGL